MKLQTTEATMIKKILNLQKTSRTSNLLSAFRIEKMEIFNHNLRDIKEINGKKNFSTLSEFLTNYILDIIFQVNIPSIFDHLSCNFPLKQYSLFSIDSH
ncbi:hypothetical protein BpHYR1_009367 [Brachionus plicatilis]|uniref:Uncharacterized protein n=1 Tax=Brachionus plicatilis TaxID=10195 RepID=A0A3M7QBX8_BRAPC|nr:hypothetical protein BpHYR1_009367 [Brachionus plicatilis]